MNVFGELGGRVAIVGEELTNQNDKYGVDTDYAVGHRTVIKGPFVWKYLFYAHCVRAELDLAP